MPEKCGYSEIYQINWWSSNKNRWWRNESTAYKTWEHRIIRESLSNNGI